VNPESCRAKLVALRWKLRDTRGETNSIRKKAKCVTRLIKKGQREGSCTKEVGKAETTISRSLPPRGGGKKTNKSEYRRGATKSRQAGNTMTVKRSKHKHVKLSEGKDRMRKDGTMFHGRQHKGGGSENVNWQARLLFPFSAGETIGCAGIHITELGSQVNYLGAPGESTSVH